ncbi:MAG: hypothetical protein JO243_17225 [Solirubrobacterales bacterium]|nr:hypothetical protein [Solirubrobacterales bacterium]
MGLARQVRAIRALPRRHGRAGRSGPPRGSGCRWGAAGTRTRPQSRSCRHRRAVVIAQQEAHRLGHQSVGTEHLLLGVALQGEQCVALMLSQRGLTPRRIRSEIGRMIGRDFAERPGLAPGIDAGALATLGIDLDTVRERVEATFGPGALARKPGGRCDDHQPTPLPSPPAPRKLSNSACANASPSGATRSPRTTS